jgi:hypothetical protein
MRVVPVREALAPAGAGSFYGEAPGVESRILSPGPDGRVFNPIVWAEFRRWRARPLTYLGIVVLVFGGICYMHFNKAGLVPGLIRAGLLPAGINPMSAWVRYIELMIQLLVRPSTILPLLMMWRALVSFRDDGMYRPFRTTFLRPGEFLWGVIAIPFAMGALILVLYTGLVLVPQMVQGYFQMAPQFRQVHPWWQIAGILYEGTLNGVLMCFIALYFGLRGNARLSALVPVVGVILLVQSAHAMMYLASPTIHGWLTSPASSWASLAGRLPEGIARLLVWYDEGRAREMDWSLRDQLPHVRLLWAYVLAGTPKLLLALVLWWRCARLLDREE